MIPKKILILVMFTFIASCELDNYNEPDGGIQGSLIDQITGENLQTQQPDGFTVQLWERGGSLPISIPGKPDGTFENSYIFQNEYDVIPIEGAFFPVDTLLVNVGSLTEVNFNVIPYLAVTNITVTPSEGQIMTNYSIERSEEEDKIVESRTLVSEIHRVNNVLFDFQSQNDLSEIPDEEILTTDHTDVVTGLSSGETYYVRIAVRTDNALGRYNYSQVFEITIP